MSAARLVLISAVVAHLAFAVATAAQVPDPLALLRGVEASRTAVQSGRLEISVLKERFAPAQGDNLVVAVVFDAAKRRCEESSRALVVDGRKNGSESKLQQMRNDREAFVRAGLGKWADVKVVSVWDGGEYKQAGTGLGA